MPSGDIQTRLPGAGGAGIDIYTITRPGAGPTPPVGGDTLGAEDGSIIGTEGGDDIGLD